MDAPNTALRGQDTTIVGRLYVAFELGDRSWKLSLGDGVRAPSRCTVAAGHDSGPDGDRQGQGALPPGH
jgi:transposase